MRATARISRKQIDDLELDITVRMKVSEWHDIMRKMPSEWPCTRLGQHISAVLGHVTKSTEVTFTDPAYAADHDVDQN